MVFQNAATEPKQVELAQHNSKEIMFHMNRTL